MTRIPESTQSSLRQRLIRRQRERWPQLADVRVRFRNPFAYVDGDREGDMLELEADHRQHAVVENVIRDLKYGLALNHMPSGKFAANAAWLALNVIAHNLTRWMGLLAGFAIACLKTWRHRFFSLPARLVRRGRRLHLRLPRGWPWQEQFLAVLAKFRAVVVP